MDPQIVCSSQDLPRLLVLMLTILMITPEGWDIIEQKWYRWKAGISALPMVMLLTWNMFGRKRYYNGLHETARSKKNKKNKLVPTKKKKTHTRFFRKWCFALVMGRKGK